MYLKLIIKTGYDKKYHMTRWMDDAIERIKNHDEKEHERIKLQNHKNEITKAKAPHLWKDLCSLIQQDVESFNDAFKDDPHRYLHFDDTRKTLTIEKKYYPGVVLQAEFKGLSIECKYETVESQNSPAKQQTIILDFKVDDNDNIYLKHRETIKRLEEVVGILLEPILFPRV